MSAWQIGRLCALLLEGDAATDVRVGRGRRLRRVRPRVWTLLNIMREPRHEQPHHQEDEAEQQAVPEFTLR